ncbi:ParA family protein [Acinetobacter sp. B5B]|uniref:ParA family protein n=1 Tax=Acinetobacter baretiae TaxID=2605383 RepID=UPI0018C2428E|nr:ParA family protein [Acinetobacter baretiae]MBF7682843.1 ParA family protein [Acinetobacter baretiae]MBF7685465.1 ParA family protein [Acinetobacter baretiae]
MKTILIANQKGGCGKTNTAITIATALAVKGYQVALADADTQKSTLHWLKQRPSSVAQIRSLDWRNEKSIGDAPKNIDYLVIDAPGAVSGEQAEQLISESHAIITPLQPSFFDLHSTKHFLKQLQDIKRIRKGKVDILLLANRVRPQSVKSQTFQDFFKKVEHDPVAWISERAVYGQLAAQGLSIFDHTQKRYLDIQKQWQPVLNVIIDDNTQWF